MSHVRYRIAVMRGSTPPAGGMRGQVGAGARHQAMFRADAAVRAFVQFIARAERRAPFVPATLRCLSVMRGVRGGAHVRIAA